MYTKEERKTFSNVAESLKKYRRADLLDEKGMSLLDELYTDLLPNNFILEKSLYDNTTFLIGRKGTGKSTIFLKLENEYRKKKQYLPCYLDVKTIYESSNAVVSHIEYLKEYISEEEINKYLLQRNFIKNVLKKIYEEIDEKKNSIIENVQAAIAGKTKDKIKKKIASLLSKIDENTHLKSIEIPILQQVARKDRQMKETQVSKQVSIKPPELDLGISSLKVGNFGSMGKTDLNTNKIGLETSFDEVFLKLFEIKDVITEIREILLTMKIKHLVLLLDDISEIDESAMKTFIDSIVAPLNNWSNEFIKFKVAFYPGRIYYGAIDPGKIDVIHLDFYDLYSAFDATQMTNNAIDFTTRLINARFAHHGIGFEKFVELSKTGINEYYEMMFNVTMNVPRIIGYIFSYLYESNIIKERKINKTDIEKASQRYFLEKIKTYFETSVCQSLTYGEMKTIRELELLEEHITGKLSAIKTLITTGRLTGKLYDPKEPYSSHFYVLTEMENLLNSLELNHYITKYDEKTDRDKNKISIFCLNYGLAYEHSILWGRKKQNTHRKYFIERPFNFSKSITNFLAKREMIICSNEECRHEYNKNDLSSLEFYDMKCKDCGSKVVVKEIVDAEFENIIKKINESEKLGVIEYSIMMELFNTDKALYARNISEEIDFSSQLVAARCKKLDNKKGYIDRSKCNGRYKYKISDAGRSFLNQRIE